MIVRLTMWAATSGSSIATEGADGSVVFLPILWRGLAVQSPVERAEERHVANGANGLTLRARAFGVLAKLCRRRTGAGC